MPSKLLYKAIITLITATQLVIILVICQLTFKNVDRMIYEMKYIEDYISVSVQFTCNTYGTNNNVIKFTICIKSELLFINTCCKF